MNSNTEVYHELVLEDQTNQTATPISYNRDEYLAYAEVGTMSFIFSLNVFGNTCVLLSLAYQRRKMTRMYYFLLHLCIADLLTAFFHVLPQIVWDITDHFYGGNLLCKSIKYLQLLGPYLSSYVLVVTAIDRYTAICFPLSNSSWRPLKSRVMISSAWIMALLCCCPQVVIFSYQISPYSGFYDCWGTFANSWGQKAYVTWYCLSVFFVPLTVLSFTHICICNVIWRNATLKRRVQKPPLVGGGVMVVRLERSEFRNRYIVPRSHSLRDSSRARIKTAQLTVIIILCYVTCSSPFICVQLWAAYNPKAQQSEEWSGPWVTILMLLASLNSCVNPYIYLLFNKPLLNGLRHCSDCCNKVDTDFSLAETNPCSTRTA